VADIDPEALFPTGLTVTPGSYNSMFNGLLDGLQSGGWTHKPVALQTLGIMPEQWLKEAAPGRVVYVWENDGSKDIQPGRAFGGWVGALSDHVVSICMMSALQEDEYFTTQDLQLKLFRPVGGTRVRIEAEVINRSRSTGYVEARWILETGKPAGKVLAWKAIRSQAELAPRA